MPLADNWPDKYKIKHAANKNGNRFWSNNKVNYENQVRIRFTYRTDSFSLRFLFRPKPKERAIQVSNIKTQLAVEYMRGQNYRQATESIEEALKSNSKMTLLGWYALRFISI